ncbi:MAG: hypothetical protein GY807_24555 [Gammaproteobacteria bacterium]|nr:hypothetical protein [Gammaproteobacteria bacterium]
MGALSAEEKAKLVAATATAASSFLEDLEHIRSVTKRNHTSRGELRRLSSLLRRLLVEKDISKIAAPRMGRVSFLTPDNTPYYKMAKDVNILFFSNSWARIFGIDLAVISLFDLGPAGNKPKEKTLEFAKKYGIRSQQRSVNIRFDNFLTQKVICYGNEWVRRLDVIKFMANIASGVHSNPPVRKVDILIERMRQACSYKLVDGRLNVHVMPELGANSFPGRFGHQIEMPSLGSRLDPVDPILVEMLGTAQMIVDSPDITELETIILKELRGKD